MINTDETNEEQDENTLEYTGMTDKWNTGENRKRAGKSQDGKWKVTYTETHKNIIYT